MNKDSSTKRARVVLVGCGSMGQTRAPLLYASPRFKLCGIVDVDVSRASEVAVKYSAIPFVTLSEAMHYFDNANTKRAGSPPQRSMSSEEDILSIETSSIDWSTDGTPDLSHPPEHASFEFTSHDKGIDGIIISSPTFTHASLIEEGAKYGIPIFVEKPVDETVEKIQHLFNVCKKANAALCCGFQRRFDNSYVATAQAIQDGTIGKPLTSTIFFGDHPCPPIEFLRKGGNIFSDLAVHDVDYIRWVLDDEVVSVFATANCSSPKLEEAGVQDTATMVLKFQGGTVATLTLSRWSCYGYDQRCEIFGDKGLAKVGSEHCNTSMLLDAHGVHASKLKYSYPQRFHQAYEAELDAFADTVLLGNAWPVTSDDCIAVLKVCEAAKRSSRLDVAVKIE